MFCFVSKNPAKKLASFLALLPKDLPWMVSENWFLVSEKSGKCQGIFSIQMSGNPVFCLSIEQCYVLKNSDSQCTKKITSHM